MDTKIADSIDKLSQNNWKIVRAQKPRTVPTDILKRYSWLPAHIVSFLTEYDRIVSQDDTSWLITGLELSGESDSAFQWNQWEIESLSVATNDPAWEKSIIDFWNLHFPILLSVKSGYAYVAIRSDLKIVDGEEPCFEETTVLADSFEAFLEMLSTNDPRLKLMI